MSSADRTVGGMRRRATMRAPARAARWSLCAALLVVTGSAAATGERPTSVHGAWVWRAGSLMRGPQGIHGLLAFCRSQSVNEVYLSVSEQELKVDDKAIGHFIGQLHGAGVRAEALVSSTTA